jgi:hypothetical protein
MKHCSSNWLESKSINSFRTNLLIQCSRWFFFWAWSMCVQTNKLHAFSQSSSFKPVSASEGSRKNPHHSRKRSGLLLASSCFSAETHSNVSIDFIRSSSLHKRDRWEYDFLVNSVPHLLHAEWFMYKNDKLKPFYEYLNIHSTNHSCWEAIDSSWFECMEPTASYDGAWRNTCTATSQSPFPRRSTTLEQLISWYYSLTTAK